MTPPRVSLVVHGCRSDGGTTSASMRGAVARAIGEPPEILEAWEDPLAPAGAAAAINRAAACAAGTVLLVVEAGWGDEATVARLVHACERESALVLARFRDADAPITLDTPSGATSADWLLRALDRDLDTLAADVRRVRPYAWAIPRDLFARLGGLDARLWSVGDVEHLAARAECAGASVRWLHTSAAVSSHNAWPLRPHVAGFLTVRNLALTSLETRAPGESGREVGGLAVSAFSSAWRASGIDARLLTFGGAWGHAALADRVTGASAARPGSALWPRDEAAAMWPVLALDSVLDEVVARPVAPARGGIDAGGASTVTGSPASPSAPGRGAPVVQVARPSIEADPPRSAAPRKVSVIVVNWNGREHLDACFSSLLASDYPADRRQILCVDNGSTDGSREFMAGRFPEVRIVALPENRGFTGGNEAGVAEATGEILVFLNNDMRVEPDMVARLVAALDDEHPCAAARVLSWDGRRIDFVRGTVNFEARGFQEHHGEPNRPELTAAADTFFPNGGAFAVTLRAYHEAGGFDAAFFAYYDDVDLGWGLRLMGFGIRVAGDAVAYHRHGATSGRQPQGQKRFLMERNALWTAVKRYGDGALDRVFGATLLLTARRIAQDARVDLASPLAQSLAPFSSRCRRRGRATYSFEALYESPTSPSAALPRGSVRRLPVESFAAAGVALADLRRVLEERHDIQARRRVPDGEILPAFGRGLEYSSSYSSYMAAQDALAVALDLPPLFRGRPRVLLVTHEALALNMAGPGVRTLELGRALSGGCAVTVATPYAPGFHDDRITIAAYSVDDASGLRRLAENADALIVQGFTLSRFPFLASLHTPIVADLYCPFTVEHLEMKAGGGLPPTPAGVTEVEADAAGVLYVQNRQLQLGDFFLCASERQRDFWLGALHSAGRINPRTYAADPTLRTLIDVVPFGVPDEPLPDANLPAVLKGVRPGIGSHDRVLLWAGSILDWQDPQTLIRAVARLSQARADVRLFFFGTRHPTPDVPPMRAVAESMALARELGVLDRQVFFNDWVPYAERGRYLREADVGVSTHRDHLETRLSFRTRMLDYIWAGLPIVCTDGDHFASLVRERGLGLVVPPGEVDALADAIARLLDDEELRTSCARHLAEAAAEMRWSRVAAPLVRFCAAPAFAADRAPTMRALTARLAGSYRLSKLLKRTALAFGVSEGRIEQVKHWRAVRALMRVRNRVALARASRPGGEGRA